MLINLPNQLKIEIASRLSQQDALSLRLVNKEDLYSTVEVPMGCKTYQTSEVQLMRAVDMYFKGQLGLNVQPQLLRAKVE